MRIRLSFLQPRTDLSPAASIIGLIVTSAYGNAFKNASITSLPNLDVSRDIDQCWRILIGLGCVPAAIALWFRLTIPETPRFTMDIERNVKQATQDIDRFLDTGRYKFDPDSIVVRVLAPRASVRDFMTYFSRWSNLRILVGCAYSWFAIDVREISIQITKVLTGSIFLFRNRWYFTDLASTRIRFSTI